MGKTRKDRGPKKAAAPPTTDVRTIVGSVLCDTQTGVFLVTCPRSIGDDTRSVTEEEAQKLLREIRGAFLEAARGSAGFLQLMRGEFSRTLRPLLRKLGDPDPGMYRFLRFDLRAREQWSPTPVSTFLVETASDEILECLLAGENKGFIDHGLNRLDVRLTSYIGDDKTILVARTNLEGIPLPYKEIPLLEEGVLPKAPTDGRASKVVRRLDSKGLQEYFTRIDGKLTELQVPLFHEFQTMLNNLKGEACPTLEDNQELVRKVNALARKYGITLLMYWTDAEGKTHLREVRMRCTPVKGTVAGTFHALTPDQHKVVLYTGTLWPQLVAGWYLGEEGTSSPQPSPPQKKRKKTRD